MLNRELFPQYGRVVILDDKMEEVKGLITLLSKQSIPFVYLDHVPEEYENYSELGVRIIFLDLVLEGATDEKTVKSVLYKNLNTLIKKDNGPYIIAVWSTQKEHYQQQIEELKDELNCSPEKIIYLDKTPFKEFKDELYDCLEKSFQEVFKDCSLLSFISLWENSINSSAIQVTSKFNEILPKGKRKASIYVANLARMMLASTIKKDTSNESKMSAAYEGLNLLLNKEANHMNAKIAKSASEIITILPTEIKVDEIEANTLLWIGDKYLYNAPKNVYLSEKIFCASMFKYNDTSDDSNIIIEIDITNKCTYFQDKTKSSGHQFVYGILFDANKFDKKESNSYLLKVGTIFYKGEKKVFIVYLGEVINKTEEEIVNEKAIFSISDEVYTEIKASLGNLYSKSGKIEF